jgi:hypothetical protein
MTTNCTAAFPLYVRLDDGRVLRIEAFERILSYLEAIDIENDEYLFWDAVGHGLKVVIKKGRVTGFEQVEHQSTLQQAFEGYAKQLGAAIDTSGTPEEVWARVDSVKQSLPRSRSLFSRLFGRLTK